MKKENINPNNLLKQDRIWRPMCHFTPPANWMNDPCGLVYFHNHYHLFYQHNPRDSDWGSIHWGHAVSSDLLTWHDAQIALFPNDTEGMAFTGSAVVPFQASAGDSWKEQPDTVVAVYTGAVQRTTPQDNHQRQCIATSQDGYSWSPEGVVLDNPGIQNFRDPKIGWHPKAGHWFMVLAVERHINIYTSPDLRSWIQTDTIKISTSLPAGVLECPDLFPLPVLKDPNETDWVLVIHIENADPADPGAYYTVGSFDGRRFVKKVDSFLPIDGGHDFYATQSWANMAPGDDRRVWIAWSANPTYARQQSTSSWTGVMSIPREIRLRYMKGRPILCQLPIQELESQRRSSAKPTREQFNHHKMLRYYQVEDALAWEILIEAETCQIRLDFRPAGSITIAREARTFKVDRTACNMGRFSDLIDPKKTIDFYPAPGGTPITRVLFDGSILECFLDDGHTVTTDLVFPESPLQGIEVSNQSWGRVQIFPLEPTIQRTYPTT